MRAPRRKWQKRGPRRRDGHGLLVALRLRRLRGAPGPPLRPGVPTHRESHRDGSCGVCGGRGAPRAGRHPLLRGRRRRGPLAQLGVQRVDGEPAALRAPPAVVPRPRERALVVRPAPFMFGPFLQPQCVRSGARRLRGAGRDNAVGRTAPGAALLITDGLHPLRAGGAGFLSRPQTPRRPPSIAPRAHCRCASAAVSGPWPSAYRRSARA